MTSRRSFIVTGLAATAAAAGLAACSGPYTLAVDVTSFGNWPSGRAPLSYAFERLPSQQEGEASQHQQELEENARAALERAGFQPAADPKTADILVSLGARLSATDYAPWDDPLWWRWHGRLGWGGAWRYGGARGWGPYPYGWGGLPLDRRYDREVAVLMRDRATGEPLYEAHASHESLSIGDGGTVSALFAAALVDFPKAQPKSHRVTVQAMR